MHSGSNAGRQCVAMSLCALTYKHKNSISSSADLASIMNTENELYSVLSRLYNQEFLLLTELPQMVTVLAIYYQVEYSPSYLIFFTACLYAMLYKSYLEKIPGHFY